MAMARRYDSGFTLIELLTVVAIIAALAGIAIPQMVAYRSDVFDIMAEHDLRAAAAAQEALYADELTYVTLFCDAALDAYRMSPGVELSLVASGSEFVGTASHPQGTGKVWGYDTTKGRIVALTITP
jgi:prepilin-type N-terminal cleavage/methylation domain-containing protein